MRECAWCHRPFEPGEKVRPLHPEFGLVHPQYHIFPDGALRDGSPVEDDCLTSEDHQREPHIHEDECTEKYCSRVGLMYRPGTQDLTDRQLEEAEQELDEKYNELRGWKGKLPR